MTFPVTVKEYSEVDWLKMPFDAGIEAVRAAEAVKNARVLDSMQTNKSSMAFDVQYKRKTEIDFISGAVSKIGKKHGIKTPLNDLMYKMIKVKEGMYS